MEKEHAYRVEEMLNGVIGGKSKKVITLYIPDHFAYRDPQLIEMIRTRYDDAKGP
jgi:predicted protein tyrosine phosphatase